MPRACRWIIFGTPSYLPWSYGRVLAHGSNECRCQCNVEECLRSGLAPVEPSTGLASQHRCKDIAKLIEWHKASIPCHHSACVIGALGSLLGQDMPCLARTCYA